MKKITTREMCDGPILPAVIRYTVPIILTSLLQLLFNAADLVVVGQFCGSNSVAAVGATSSLVHLIVNLFMGLSVGAGVTVAQGLGARDDLKVKQAVHTAIPMAIISGAFITVIGVCFSGRFLQWMGTPEKTLPLSTLYLRIYFAGILFTMLYNFGAAILRAAGDTSGPLKYLAFAGVLNIVMNLIFVVLLDLDVAGVALATSLSQAVSAVLVLRALVRRKDACHLEWKEMGIHRIPLLRMLRIGVPAGIQSSLFSISNVLIQSSINLFGEVALAGNSAAATIEGFVFVAMNAFNQTAMNFAGQNVGAGNYERVRKIYRTCLVSAAVVGVLLGGLARLFGTPLLSIYISDSTAAIQYGLTRLTYICLLYALCGIMDVTTGILRGMGVSISTTIITVLGVCGMRVFWVFTIFQIPAFHTLESLYLSYPISWVLSFIAELIVFYWILHRRLKRKI